MFKYVFLFTFWTLVGYGAIKEVSSLEPIHQAIETVDEKTLVLVDVGGTLLDRIDPVLHSSHEEWVKNWFQKNAPNLSEERASLLKQTVEQTEKSWQLTDAKWPDLIEEFKLRGAKVVAFTKVLKNPALSKLRASRLIRFGIDLQDPLPELASNQETFVYSQGVIETSEKLKGAVLEKVLPLLLQRPNKIIFIDDRKEQIASVYETCQKEGISCLAFHYVTPSVFLDETIADLQLQILVKENRWLPVDEITKLESKKS